jgi:hypothetical protein
VSEHRRTFVRDGVAILGCFLLLGLVGAVLWWLLVDPAVYTVTARGGSMGEPELAQRFDPDGWFVVIGLLGGLLGGALLSWWRARDPLRTTILVVLGALLATGVVIALGRILGPADPETLIPSLAPGHHVPVRLVITTKVSALAWPFGALVGCLAFLWSPVGEAQDDPDLQDETEPDPAPAPR